MPGANTGVTQRLPREERQPMIPGSAQASVSHSNDGRTTITITVDRGDIRDVIDRWTYGTAQITIESGDKSATVQFPKITEQVPR